MKNKKRKWLCAAMVLANVVMLGNTMSIQSLAAGTEIQTNGGVAVVTQTEEGSISIRGNSGQSMQGKEFSVYKLMTAENSVDGKSIDYTLNQKYMATLQAVVADEKEKIASEITEYEIIDYMQSLNSNDKAFADEELELEGRYSDYRYFIEKVMQKISGDGLEGDVVVQVKNTKNDNSVEIQGLEYGYYLVQDTSNAAGNHTAVSMLMIGTSNPDSSVSIKADYPSVTKKIQEDDGLLWNDFADFEIGQDVPYRYVSNIPNMNGYSKYYYAWHDKMDEALSLQEDSISIEIAGKVNGSDKKYTLKNEEFNLLTTVVDESFVIEIEDIKSIVDREFNAKNANGENIYGQSVTVTYNATLNDKAALDGGRPGFENDVRLEFSNNPWEGYEEQTGYTPWDTVVCFTYGLDGVKINNYGTELEGAKFRLYTDETCENEVYVKKVADRYHVMNEDSYEEAPENSVEMVSAADGTFFIYGLDSGTYYLKEVEAPAGYRPILDPIRLVITAEFPENRDAYVKGEAAGEDVLKLSAFAKTKVYVNGAYVEKEVELQTDQEKGTFNISVVNDIGKKLPITGSYAVPVMMTAGMTLIFVSYQMRKKHEE